MGSKRGKYQRVPQHKQVKPGSILPETSTLVLFLDYVEEHPPNIRCQIGLAGYPVESGLWRSVGIFRSVYKGGDDAQVQSPGLHLPALLDVVYMAKSQIVLL